MPFLLPVGLGLGGALLGKAFGGDKKPKVDPLQAQLNPLIETQKRIAQSAADSGLANTAAARKEYDFVNTYLKKILTGSDDELLKTLDAAGATRNADENEQLMSELSVRGGRRAAELSQASFDRSASIDNILKQLRFAAPMQIAQISQAIGNLGLGELSASTGSSAQASNTIFNIEKLKDADADRRAALIGSIFETIGGIGGAIAAS